MKANELMVGDWVQLYGVPTRWELEDYAKWHKEMEREDITTFEPIPLTSEILEKNGFEKCNEDTDGAIQYEFGSENLGIDIWVLGSMTESCLLGAWNKWPDCTELYDMITEMPIHYVHELQHALRLCKIEKEIKIN